MTKDAFYSREREIAEIEALIPEIREKIADTKDMAEETVKKLGDRALMEENEMEAISSSVTQASKNGPSTNENRMKFTSYITLDHWSTRPTTAPACSGRNIHSCCQSVPLFKIDQKSKPNIHCWLGLWAGRVDHWWLLSCYFSISSITCQKVLLTFVYIILHPEVLGMEIVCPNS